MPWSTETYVAREFEGLGHEVTRMTFPQDTLPEIEGAARAHDLLIMQGAQLPPEAVSLFRRVEEHGTVTAGYHLDIFCGLKREHRVFAESFWRMGHVFTADGDPETQAFMDRNRVNHHWLPAACVSDECVMTSRRPDLACDVVFVGARHYHEEWPWRRELLRTIQSNYGGRSHIYDGNSIRGRDLNALYASAGVVVGDSMFADRRTNYWSDRYYETVGRGGFLLAPRVKGLEDHFADGLHLSLYDVGDTAGLCDQIDFWLAHQAQARDIAACGQEHVRSTHTYRHRVLELLNVVGLS